MARRTESVEVAPREAETPQVVEIDRERMRTEQVRDAAFNSFDQRRVDAAQTALDPAEFARQRREAELAELPDEDVPAQEAGDVSGLAPLKVDAEGLVWTGRNIDQMIEFCGPDPLGGNAATFSHEWTGEAKLHVHDASVHERDAESFGVTHDVAPGQVVVRQGKRPGGGWERLYPVDEGRMGRRFRSADSPADLREAA